MSRQTEKPYTLYDYLDWRGDLSFAVSPLNEVDALIFSILSYADMDNLFRSSDEYISIRDLNGRYINEGINQSELAYNPAPLLNKCAQSARFGGIKVCRYADILEQEDEIQFSACTFILNSREVFAAFRGTDNTLIGWREDFKMTASPSIPAQKHAVEYLNQDFLLEYEKIYAGGHSKGGNLAVYGSAFCRPETKEKITMIFNNDGPGFRRELWETDNIKSVLPKVITIVPDTSVIGLLLTHIESPVIIDSKLPPFLSHDPFSWRVLGKRFIREDKLSPVSLYIIETLNNWLDTISDQERLDFIDTIFNSIDETGVKRAAELRRDLLKTYRAIFNAFSKSDPKKQQLVTELFIRLAKTGTDTAILDLKKALLPQTVSDRKES